MPNLTHGTSPTKRSETPTLAGSRETETRLNKTVDESGIVRVVDNNHLKQLIIFKLLLPLPQAVCVDYKLDRMWRWAVPWTVYFLSDLGSEFDETFGHCLQVNSSVRTVARQLEIILVERNRNAAPAYGERRSLHFAGTTVDIAKKNLSKPEVKWLRRKFLLLEKAGLIDATEEFGQAVFHITVWPSYSSTN
ncbi:MAG: DUF5715 family protein [Minisyncoccia bacterium]